MAGQLFAQSASLEHDGAHFFGAAGGAWSTGDALSPQYPARLKASTPLAQLASKLFVEMPFASAFSICAFVASQLTAS